MMDPDVRLAVFGTFNPVGPTFNTIGVLELADGRYLLANWMRHPFSPEYSPVLVLPDLDPATVWNALVEVLPFYAVGTADTDFVGVHAPETFQASVSSAFMKPASDRDQLGESGPRRRFWRTIAAIPGQACIAGRRVPRRFQAIPPRS